MAARNDLRTRLKYLGCGGVPRFDEAPVIAQRDSGTSAKRGVLAPLA